jgi:hypothetical protein
VFLNRLFILICASFFVCACSDSSGNGSSTGSTTGTDGGNDGTDGVEATTGMTDSTTAMDSDSQDATDGQDEADTTDGSAATDGVDGSDDQDATDGTTAIDGSAGADGTDETTSTGPDPEITGGIVEALGCWAPDDIAGIDCTEFCATPSCALPDCEQTCPSFFAFYDSADTANQYMNCIVEQTCSDDSFGPACLKDIPAPHSIPEDCSAMAALLESCNSSQAEVLTTWCAEVGPYLKPEVFAPTKKCLESGCSVDPVACLLEQSCILYHVFQPEEGGVDSGMGDDSDGSDGDPNDGSDGGPNDGSDGGPNDGSDGGPNDGSDGGPGF